MYRTATGKPPSAYKAAPRTFAPSAPQCPRCDKSVYAAEQVLGPGGREYHKHCLTCVSCKKTVQPGGFQEHEGDAYCKHCYGKLFGTKGLGYGGAMTGDYVDPLLSRSPYSSPGRSGTPNHRASGAFSESSRVTGGGGESPSKDGSFRGSPASVPALPGRSSIESPLSKYRTSRLQEIEDDRSNDSLGEMDLDNDEDGSTTSLRQQDALPDQRSRTHSINAAQQAEAPAFDEHTPSPAASPVKQQWAPPSASFRGSPLKHSMPSDVPRPASPASSIGTSATESSSRGADLPGAKFNSNLGLLQSSGPALCRRCATPVYHAEQVVAGGHKWHKRCLRCAKCSKALDSHLMEKDNLPYCKRCYDDQWGLKSQGFVLRPGLH